MLLNTLEQKVKDVNTWSLLCGVYDFDNNTYMHRTENTAKRWPAPVSLLCDMTTAVYYVSDEFMDIDLFDIEVISVRKNDYHTPSISVYITCGDTDIETTHCIEISAESIIFQTFQTKKIISTKG